jgi:hypothetical protein
MSTTEQIIQKADFALADLSGGTNGGLLNPEQSNAFLVRMLNQPTITKLCRVVPMSGPKKNIDKIGFGKRILRPGAGINPTNYLTAAVDHSQWANPTWVPLTENATRAKPATNQVVLSTKEVIAEVWLPYDVIEDNIARGEINFAGPNAPYQPVSGGIKDVIVGMIAERAALDLEELFLLGDTTLSASDPYLAQFDGMLKLAGASGNPVTTADLPGINKSVFKRLMKVMPDQYLRNLNSMRHFTSVNNEIEYRDTLANRETGSGDAIIDGRNPVFAYGVPVTPAALMPETKVLLTDPKNLILGVQRQVSIEVDKDIRGRNFIIVLTMRLAMTIEEPMAVAITTDLANLGNL